MSQFVKQFCFNLKQILSIMQCTKRAQQIRKIIDKYIVGNDNIANITQ